MTRIATRPGPRCDLVRLDAVTGFMCFPAGRHEAEKFEANRLEGATPQ
jgi:hypothetical protein